MAEETRKYDIECLRIEKGQNKDYRFVFGYQWGECPLEEGEEYYDLFKPGQKYLEVVKASGMPDFIGQEDKMENVCTVSYELEKILCEETIIWEK